MKTQTATAFALILVMQVAAAATYHVDANNPNAADSNAGTEDHPFKTIGAAAKMVQPGDTVLIKEGTYRESLRLKPPGDSNQPITFRAAPGARAILSGADLLDGWKKCQATEVGAHPHADKLFMLDLDWIPISLYEGFQQMTLARTPDVGWWGISEGLSLSEFTDTTNLTQKDPLAWSGWTVAILEQAGGGTAHIAVKAFDPATNKITLESDYSRFRKKIDEKRDRYYMENHLAALDGPGQYVFQKTATGCRLFVWPSKPGDNGLPRIQAPVRDNIISLTKQSNLVIDGLEICLSKNYGLGMGTAGSPVNVTIQNCHIHHNEGYGIEMRKPVKCLIRRNIIRENSHGIVMGGSQDTVIEENDIGFNRVDGICAPYGTRNLLIQRNYIHDHYLWGHPDNIQFWSDVGGVVIRDNVMVNSGQIMMSDGMKNTKLINNIWLGSRAIALIAGGDGWEITGNTVCASGPMPTNLNAKNITLIGNIIAPLHAGPLYGMSDPETFLADHNLLWAGPDYSKALVIKGAWKASAASIDEIREKFGQEAHGLVVDPKLRNVPRLFAVTDYARVPACTTSRFIFRGSDAGMFAVGDHVELDFDGVPRKVVEVGSDFIVVDKPLPMPPIAMQTIANWGDRTDYRWDVRPAEGSPALKAGPDGRDIGSNLVIQDYIKGDFNGDGKRDLVELPKD